MLRRSKIRTGNVTRLVVFVYSHTAVVTCHVCNTDFTPTWDVIVIVRVAPTRYREICTSIIRLAYYIPVSRDSVRHDGQGQTIAVNTSPSILAFTFLPIFSLSSMVAICQ